MGVFCNPSVSLSIAGFHGRVENRSLTQSKGKAISETAGRRTAEGLRCLATAIGGDSGGIFIPGFLIDKWIFLWSTGEYLTMVVFVEYLLLNVHSREGVKVYTSIVHPRP